jgi:predicted nucleotidyltransferase
VLKNPASSGECGLSFPARQPCDNIQTVHGNSLADRQEIVDKLRQNEAALRARGVSHAALFGSRARGDNRPDSDIDIMIEVDPAAEIGVYEYVALKDYIAALFDRPVDIVSRDGLKPYVKPAVTTDAIYAF